MVPLLALACLRAATLTHPAGDANGDGRVDQADLDLVIANLGRRVYPGTLGDIDRSGRVGPGDREAVRGNPGRTCE